MSRNIEIDVSEARDFFQKMQNAGRSGQLKKDMALWLRAVGTEFLRVIQDEIIRREVVDTRQLLASFHEGGDGSHWDLSEGDLTLEVGSTVDYAKWVNDGHFQQPGRFIPGRWEGKRFIYDESAKGGMVLKANWVKGKPFFDSAVRIIEKMLPGLLEAKLEKWLNQYFGM